MIQSLVRQLESSGEGSKLEGELVEETQALVEQFKEKESLEAEMRREIAQGQTLLAERDGEIQGLKTEREALKKQVCVCMYM